MLRSHTNTLCFDTDAEPATLLLLFSTPNSGTLPLSWLVALLITWFCEEVVKRRTFLGETQQIEVAGDAAGRLSLALAALRRRRCFVVDDV